MYRDDKTQGLQKLILLIESYSEDLVFSISVHFHTV